MPLFEAFFFALLRLLDKIFPHLYGLNMKFIKIFAFLFIVTVSVAVFQSCKQLQDISKSLTDIQNLQFKLDNVDNFQLGGIGLSNKKSVSDFSITDGLKLSQMYSSSKLPARFTLNVAAKNPNDGKKAGTKSSVITLTRLDWRLLIDNEPTIQGTMNKELRIPSSGESTIIPLEMEIDLYEFFGKQGYEKIANLAMAIGGANSSPARLKLDATPTVSTPIGTFQAPRITIVDHEYK
jgi:hypothetical protein